MDEQLNELKREGLNLGVLDNWQAMTNDDDIHEP